MPRLILLAAVALTVYILFRRAQAQPPHNRRAAYLQLLFGGAAVIAVMLTLAGKMHWLGAALTGAVVMLRQSLPLVMRAFPLLSQWLQSRQAKAAGQQSEVRTLTLWAHTVPGLLDEEEHAEGVPCAIGSVVRFSPQDHTVQ